ncbi:MAG: hypothetical protein A2014_00590 [Spirochaetes bacterium GWF1_49_6]|nr:MAG: hypothetical protein A2014_00590 [Spirochaetes bacterium GWF1_49_6]
MRDDWKRYSDANRAAWNEAAAVHKKTRPVDLHRFFTTPGATLLDPAETAILESFGLAGKRIAQLSCNNGRELISAVNIGALAGAGFDISDEFIREARELAEIAHAGCEFVRADIIDIPETYNSSYDIVYITVGALAWIPDLDIYFGVASRLLKPGGNLFIYEHHPVTYLLPFKDKDYQPGGLVLKPEYSYFNKTIIEGQGLDYFGNTGYDASKNYEFQHTMGGIINSVIRAGIEIRELNEYPHDIAGFGWAESLGMFPLSYSLIGRKK